MAFPIAGTLINVATVIAGTAVGVVLGNRLPERMRETVLNGLGLITMVVGLSMAITTHNLLIPLFSVLMGGIAGEALNIDAALTRLGVRIEGWVCSARGGRGGSDTRLVQGFVTASLIFCVGPMAILGAVQDGLMGDYTLLAVKSLMDGFASMALAASLGVGVGLSAITLFGYQGGISLLATIFAAVLGGVTRTTPWVTEMTATGGVVILSIAFMLLDVKRIRAANLLPAIVFAPLIVLLLGRLGISY